MNEFSEAQQTSTQIASPNARRFENFHLRNALSKASALLRAPYYTIIHFVMGNTSLCMQFIALHSYGYIGLQYNTVLIRVYSMLPESCSRAIIHYKLHLRNYFFLFTRRSNYLQHSSCIRSLGLAATSFHYSPPLCARLTSGQTVPASSPSFFHIISSLISSQNDASPLAHQSSHTVNMYECMLIAHTSTVPFFY